VEVHRLSQHHDQEVVESLSVGSALTIQGVVRRAVCAIVPIASPATISSTRRFCCRPVGVSLDATGWVSRDSWTDAGCRCLRQRCAPRSAASGRGARAGCPRHVRAVRSGNLHCGEGQTWGQRHNRSSDNRPNPSYPLPPLNYPIPPDAKRLHPKGVAFLGNGVGLPGGMTLEATTKPCRASFPRRRNSPSRARR
jgi:hypothetical protein